MKFKNFIKRPAPYIKKAFEVLLNQYRVFAFEGNKVKCTICSWNGSRFFDGNCPGCNSLPRTRLIPFALKYFDLLKNPVKLLHVAPNVNEYSYMRKVLKETSIYDRLNINKVPHINIIADLTQTGLQGDQYDLSIAWHVLEHIPEDIKAISEVYRLLKPGGHFLVSVPIFPVDRKQTYEDKSIPYKDFEKVHGHYDHCRSCGLDYYKRFEDVGFKTKELSVRSLEKTVIDEFGLSIDHVVWCFEK